MPILYIWMKFLHVIFFSTKSMFTYHTFHQRNCTFIWPSVLTKVGDEKSNPTGSAQVPTLLGWSLNMAFISGIISHEWKTQHSASLIACVARKWDAHAFRFLVSNLLQILNLIWVNTSKITTHCSTWGDTCSKGHSWSLVSQLQYMGQQIAECWNGDGQNCSATVSPRRSVIKACKLAYVIKYRTKLGFMNIRLLFSATQMTYRGISSSTTLPKRWPRQCKGKTSTLTKFAPLYSIYTYYFEIKLQYIVPEQNFDDDA